jgi:acetolactate synthase-1/2/3 large subunit
VCTGAADGYARMTGRPALTLLHLGPGLVNGLANLHNARRAGSPVVNPVGEHATWHRPHDPALASGIRSLAAAVSGWVRTATSPGTLAADGAAAAAGRWRPWSCRPAASGSPAASQQRSSSPGGSAHGSVMV